MSYLTYIASDYPLRTVKNPHERCLSVNEALAMEIETPSIRTRRIRLDELTPEDIRKIDEQDIKIETIEGYELATQYRYVITKS